MCPYIIFSKQTLILAKSQRRLKGYTLVYLVIFPKNLLSTFKRLRFIWGHLSCCCCCLRHHGSAAEVSRLCSSVMHTKSKTLRAIFSLDWRGATWPTKGGISNLKNEQSPPAVASLYRKKVCTKVIFRTKCLWIIRGVLVLQNFCQILSPKTQPAAAIMLY